VAVGYTGTVHFSSTDPAANLPANYTFTAADAGSHTFTATLNTGGTQSIGATDTANGGVGGTQGNITVHTAVTSVIAVPGRRDLVYDEVRGLLYITTAAGTIERYDIANQTLLTPLSVGGSLNGGDITPDGSALYVADGQRGITQGWFDKVNLATGAPTHLPYDLSAGAGAWDVTIGANGKALADTNFEGSGWVPLQQITLSTDTLSVRTDDPGSGFNGGITGDTHIARSADRSRFLFTEANISSGPAFDYDGIHDVFPHSTQTNLYLDRSRPPLTATGPLPQLVSTAGSSSMMRR
jgi:hypothetical protein